METKFAALMQRMRALRAGIAPSDSAQRFRELGGTRAIAPANGGTVLARELTVDEIAPA